MNTSVNIISFVGIPASGKTTLASYLGQSFPLSVFAREINILNNNILTPGDQLEVIYQEHKRIIQLKRYSQLMNIKTVFQDRGIEDILCFSNFIYQNNPDKLSLINDAVNELNILSDFVIFLNINKREQQSRENSRKKVIFDRNGINMPYYNIYYKKFFMNYKKAYIFDNSIDLNSAVNGLKSIIDNHFNKMSAHTAKHIYNSHKPILKPKIAKELVCLPPLFCRPKKTKSGKR